MTWGGRRSKTWRQLEIQGWLGQRVLFYDSSLQETLLYVLLPLLQWDKSFCPIPSHLSSSKRNDSSPLCLCLWLQHTIQRMTLPFQSSDGLLAHCIQGIVPQRAPSCTSLVSEMISVCTGCQGQLLCSCLTCRGSKVSREAPRWWCESMPVKLWLCVLRCQQISTGLLVEIILIETLEIKGHSFHLVHKCQI